MEKENVGEEQVKLREYTTNRIVELTEAGSYDEALEEIEVALKVGLITSEEAAEYRAKLTD